MPRLDAVLAIALPIRSPAPVFASAEPMHRPPATIRVRSIGMEAQASLEDRTPVATVATAPIKEISQAARFGPPMAASTLFSGVLKIRQRETRQKIAIAEISCGRFSGS